MAITYPLAIPTGAHIVSVGWSPQSVVAVAESPFTLSQQVQVHPGERWQVQASVQPMNREQAQEWICWRLALRGMAGTFLMGDPTGMLPRGTVGSGITLDGAHSARAREVDLKGGAPGATVLAGDYLQLGSGLSARLHKVLLNGTFDTDGKLTVDVWPGLRADYANGAAVTASNCVGLFRLASNEMPWDVNALVYGFDFTAVEAL